MPPANNNAAQGQTQYSTMLFLGAPLSKLVAAMTAIAYFAIYTKHASSAFDFDAAMIRDRGETHRYVTSKLTFASTGNLVIGTLFLTFLMRKFEREMGTRKMLIFCLFVHTTAIAVEYFLVHSAFLKQNFRYGGPYSLIGALFFLYHRYTPRLHPRFFSVLGVNFSEKIFQYIWLTQVSISGGRNSAYSVGIGLLSGIMYEVVPFIKKLDVPDAVADIFGDLSSRILVAPPRILVPQVGRGGLGGGRGGLGGGRGGAFPRQAAGAGAAAAAAAAAARPAAPAAAPRPAAADPAAVEQLTLMGFSRAQVVEALLNTNNDVQRAADRLLTQQGSQ